MKRPRVGQKVVVPGCEVGEVVGIEVLPGQSGEFVHILLESGARTWVPAERVYEQGIRHVMSRAVAKAVLETVAQQKAPTKRANWNQRKRRYTEMLLTNEPKTLAALLGELGAVKAEKGSLAWSERKLFDQTWEMLVAEIGIALKVNRGVAETHLEEALAA